jgi:hypothetical protein
MVLEDFLCTRFTCYLEAVTPVCFEEFCGSTLRGGLGRVLKELVCTRPPGICTTCDLRHTCAYGYIFETAPPPGSERLRNLDNIPRPYVVDPLSSEDGIYPDSQPIAPNSQFVPGEIFRFDLVLIGRAIPYISYLTPTLEILGRRGAGPARGRFRIRTITAPDRDGQTVVSFHEGRWLRDDFSTTPLAGLSQQPLPRARRLCVEFLSPTRITADKRVQRDVSFEQLTRALLRRLSSLCYFHCGIELNLDFTGLIDQASRIRTCHSDLRWIRQKRISGRQHQPVYADGVQGSVVYECPEGNWQPFQPLLAAGQLVHVGKTCVMGAGKIRFYPLPD